MGPGEALAFVTLMVSLGTVIVLRGPLGKAIADRIAGRPARDPDAAAELRDIAERLSGELDDVRRRLAEVEERQDFAERLLAQAKQPGLPGRGS